MRNTQLTNSSKKTQSISKSRSKSKSLNSIQIENKFYFCHYKNAMYMGGMKSFHRNGSGIIIHDNGSSSICSHYHDFKHGHNIVFSQNCLMSIIYEKNRMTESLVRFSQHLLYLKYNKQSQLDGKGVFIDFSKRSILYLSYNKNVLVTKREEKEYAVINRVFQLENYQFLVGHLHSKVLKFEIEEIQNIVLTKNGGKVSIGFGKRGLLNGLGFSISLKQGNSGNEQNAFYLRFIDKGYYQNSQLNGMGEKLFKNGNYYVGDFKDNIFEGRGILKNKEKNNWVYGCFSKGNMSELIQYSHEGDLTKFRKLVEILHQRKSSWIDKQIILQNPDYFEKEIQKINSNKQSSQYKTLIERKQEVLRKIQDNFVHENGHYQNLLENISNEQESNIKSFQEEEVQQDKARDVIEKSDNIISPRNERMNESSRISQPRSIYRVNILEVPSNQDSNSTYKKQEAQTPNKSSKKGQIGSGIQQSQKSMGYSQIQEQSPTFKLDSKRLIGKSRLFKFNGKEQEDEKTPSFTYTPKK